jgi:Transposase and inactivated derivatives
MWYVGIDWAETHHDLAVINEAGKLVGTRRFEHNPTGLNNLKQFLFTFTTDPEQLACIVETSHGLLISFLLDAGLPVYAVNPQSANQLRKTAGAKTDQIDARLLAKFGRFEFTELRRLKPDAEIVQQLKLLTRKQDSLIAMQTRLSNQLTASLKEYYPVALRLFSSVRRVSALHFLHTYPTPHALEQASLAEIECTLREGTYPAAPKHAREIFALARQPQLRANEAIVQSESRWMLVLIEHLQLTVQQIADYDKEISTLFLRHDDHSLWLSLPGVGHHLAPRLLAEWGDDRSRYGNAAAVQALSGTAPVPYQSGTYANAHRRKACVKPLRNVLYQLAWQMSLRETWAKEYYQRKVAAGKTHSEALRSLANVLVRIIYRMWSQKTDYDARIFEEAQQKHARRAA